MKLKATDILIENVLVHDNLKKNADQTACVFDFK